MIDSTAARALDPVRADDREEDLGRQHLEISAEHERIAEIREALDEAEQEGVGEARPHQRQRDGRRTSSSSWRAGSARLLPGSG